MELGFWWSLDKKKALHENHCATGSGVVMSSLVSKSEKLLSNQLMYTSPK